MKKILVLSMLSLLAACSADDIQPKVTDGAFNALRKHADEVGGAVTKLIPGEAATLEVTDPESPIYGAAVSLPADALPADAKRPVLSILPAGAAEDGVLEAGLLGKHKASGPGVLIKLFSLADEQPIPLQAAARVTLPLAENMAFGIAGHLEDGQTEWVALKKLVLDAEKRRVSGNTASFSLFVSLLGNLPLPGPCNQRVDKGDGTIREVNTYTYDGNGFRVKRERDKLGDGSIDEVQFYTNDAKGLPTKIEVDSDNDGTIDSISIRTFNSYGDLLRLETDTNNDGSADQFGEYTYEYNDKGLKILESFDNNNDKAPDIQYRYTYSAEGYLTGKTEDHDWDGIGSADPDGVDFTYIVTPDMRGNTLKEQEFDPIANELAATFDDYTYDLLGNLVESRIGAAQDGSFSLRFVNDYSCWDY